MGVQVQGWMAIRKMGGYSKGRLFRKFGNWSERGHTGSLPTQPSAVIVLGLASSYLQPPQTRGIDYANAFSCDYPNVVMDHDTRKEFSTLKSRGDIVTNWASFSTKKTQGKYVQGR
jgi:hypothetical protein